METGKGSRQEKDVRAEFRYCLLHSRTSRAPQTVLEAFTWWRSAMTSNSRLTGSILGCADSHV